MLSTTQKVVVAVRAADKKEISKTALAWALTHILHPGDCITLLAVLYDPHTKKPGRKLWNFAAKFRSPPTDHIYQISESFSQMVLQFNDQNQVGVRIKVVSGSPAGVVAAESKKAGANWVVLDKQLKEEEKHCMEELHCNIVVMKRSQAKVLRVNLGSSNDAQPFSSSSPSIWQLNSEEDSLDVRIKHSTPVSSPDGSKSSSFRKLAAQDSSMSSSGALESPFYVCEQNPLFERDKKEKVANTPSTRLYNNKDSVHWIPQNHTAGKCKKLGKDAASKTLLEKFVQIDQERRIQALGLKHNTNHIGGHVFNSDVREAVSLSRPSSAPPPLCSLCQLKSTVFGKPPRWFDYRELEEATGRFSNANSLAEDGFGSVHRGVLSDGQVVAVKQLTETACSPDSEFCREVGVLSSARHRNVVTMIGFCIEGKMRVLVYEYVCNSSLDFHLYGGRRHSLDWNSRVKVAVGTARGLRYLHEDCRVGCIVHRNLRPNNILLTHDFEPLVGDFGVAKWRPETDLRAAEPRSLDGSGYLAPEYIEDAKITEKADIYAFGVVLKELITGRKTANMARSNGKQFLAEWYYHLLALEEQGQTQVINPALVDPRLDPDELLNSSHQLQAMAHAASLCLRRDPESRPPMSKVLRALEGGNALVPLTFKLDSAGNQSARMSGLNSYQRTLTKGNHCRTLSH